jgi:hypothetical protein
MTDNKHITDAKLDALLDQFFQAEKADGQALSTDLMDRVLRDAETVQHDRLAGRQAEVSKPSRWASWRFDFLDALGGWPTAAVLGLFLVLGVSIGYGQPDGLGDLTQSVIGATGLEFATGEYFLLDDLMAEG